VFLLTDLARELATQPNPLAVEIEFIKAMSYGDKTVSDGVVELEHFPGTVLNGRNVIIIEDIIDSGHTLKALSKYLKDQGPSALKICTLLDKPDRREVKGLNCEYGCNIRHNCILSKFMHLIPLKQ
jgi:hypoxanthine phosphoribosyltransferase